MPLLTRPGVTRNFVCSEFLRKESPQLLYHTLCGCGFDTRFWSSAFLRSKQSTCYGRSDYEEKEEEDGFMLMKFVKKTDNEEKRRETILATRHCSHRRRHRIGTERWTNCIYACASMLSIVIESQIAVQRKCQSRLEASRVAFNVKRFSPPPRLRSSMLMRQTAAILQIYRLRTWQTVGIYNFLKGASLQAFLCVLRSCFSLGFFCDSVT